MSKSTAIVRIGHDLRLQATKNIPRLRVNRGDIGAYIEGNCVFEGDGWADSNSSLSDSYVSGSAIVGSTITNGSVIRSRVVASILKKTAVMDSTAEHTTLEDCAITTESVVKNCALTNLKLSNADLRGEDDIRVFATRFGPVIAHRHIGLGTIVRAGEWSGDVDEFAARSTSREHARIAAQIADLARGWK